MNKTEKRKNHLLVSLAFSTAVLSAVHLLTFVWQTTFVYQENIRGYVPAGITGLFILVISSCALLIYLWFVARKYKSFSLASGKYQSSTGKYILGGILGVPAAIIICSIYSWVFISLFGYTLQNDVTISLIGSIFMTSMAVWLHIKYVYSKQLTSH